MDTVIHTSGLTKRFGRRAAVDGLDLEVRRGQIFGFLGPNGAGKSTTIRLLLGLLRPNAGEIQVLGRRIPHDRLRVARRVGALVESPAFYDHLSGRCNLDLLASLSGGCERTDVQRVLELVGLSDRQHDKVGGYSHGMRQRLGIAQALLPRPELVVLDEPATGLDPKGLTEVRQLMRLLRDEEGVTILLSSHLLHEVELICTDVAVISKGKIVRQGSVRDLLTLPQRGSRVEVDVDDVDRAMEVARRLPYVSLVEVGNSRLRVSLSGGAAADLNAGLVAAGVRVSGLSSSRSSLEEIYLALMAEEEHAGDPAG